tara:strand:+ start:675 stop:935 length:261 start_codon:yes stop_codon:yes gene_type:complete
MPWNPEYYMNKDEVIKILEDNKITNVMKKQNPVAKEVRTPKYKQRVVKDKTVYDRKKIPSEEEEDDKMRFEDHLHEINAVEKLKYK